MNDDNEPETGDGDDDANPPAEEDADGDFSDMADEGNPGDEGNEEPNAGEPEASPSSGGNQELVELQQSTFSNLSEEQIRIRSNNIKQSFIDLYNDIIDIIDRMSTINKIPENLSSINFTINSLNELKNMIEDAVADSFDTRTLIENQLLLQKFITHYGMLIHIIEKLKVDNKE